MLITIVTALSGLAMFLYGMKIMGDGLERIAGEKLQTIIGSLTGNMITGVIFGAIVTAIIQSSSATTVMVVGFVNVGIMTLPQAAAVIMGANIGTTVTAQILRLGGADFATFMQYLKPEFLSSVAIIIGVLCISMSKKEKVRDGGIIALGFGLLFLGMETMSDQLSTFKEYSWFQNIFLYCQNPITGLLAGTSVTAVIQSSSASVGILQALSDTGTITYASAIPIIFGQNIGTCVTAILSSIGAKPNARKAAMIHLYYNVIGSLLMLLIYTLPFVSGLRELAQATVIDRGGIANVHLLFNVANTIMLLPFAKYIIKLANITVGADKKVSEDTSALDVRFLNLPSVALAQCENQIKKMFELTIQNIEFSRRAVVENDIECLTLLNENEQIIDSYEVDINNYVTQITDLDISDSESRQITSIFHTVTDLERISDHTKNIGETAAENFKKKKGMSDKAKRELNLMFSAVKTIADMTYEAYKNNNLETAYKLKPCEEVIDMFNHTLRNKHISRLKAQKCSVRAGVNFLDVITNLERIGDHCNNISLTVIRKNTDEQDFDIHKFSKNMELYPDRNYNLYFREFEEKFYKPLVDKEY